ncbi:hypothetical protein HOH51_01205 [bacterium]|jgi:hypothetical protein|nr:hypothetical protein [bacterium]
MLMPPAFLLQAIKKIPKRYMLTLPVSIGFLYSELSQTNFTNHLDSQNWQYILISGLVLVLIAVLSQFYSDFLINRLSKKELRIKSFLQKLKTKLWTWVMSQIYIFIKLLPWVLITVACFFLAAAPIFTTGGVEAVFAGLNAYSFLWILMGVLVVYCIYRIAKISLTYLFASIFALNKKTKAKESLELSAKLTENKLWFLTCRVATFVVVYFIGMTSSTLMLMSPESSLDNTLISYKFDFLQGLAHTEFYFSLLAINLVIAFGINYFSEVFNFLKQTK